MRPVWPSGLTQAVGAPNNAISRLDTLPIPAPVNACHVLSREYSHDSGPVWFATPSLQGTFTLHFLPACPGASGKRIQIIYPRPRSSFPPSQGFSGHIQVDSARARLLIYKGGNLRCSSLGV